MCFTDSHLWMLKASIFLTDWNFICVVNTRWLWGKIDLIQTQLWDAVTHGDTFIVHNTMLNFKKTEMRN